MEYRSVAWGFLAGVVVGASAAVAWIGPKTIILPRTVSPYMAPVADGGQVLILADEAPAVEQAPEVAPEAGNSPRFVVPAPDCRGSKLPKNSQPHRFNGGTYYIVPLAAGR